MHNRIIIAINNYAQTNGKFNRNLFEAKSKGSEIQKGTHNRRQYTFFSLRKIKCIKTSYGYRRSK